MSKTSNKSYEGHVGGSWDFNQKLLSEGLMALDTYTFHPVRVESTEEGNYKAKNSYRKATKCSNLCKIFFPIMYNLLNRFALSHVYGDSYFLTSGREKCGQEILGI